MPMQQLYGGLFKQIDKPQSVHPPSVPVDVSQYEDEYITYCIEQERSISELESGLHTNDDPEEIAKKALAAACAFYDADWAGVIEIDLELNIWATGWWYNIDPTVKQLEKLQEFENLMVMPSIVEAIKKQKPIIFSDVEDIAKSSPKEYQVYKRLEVRSVMAVPFGPKPMPANEDGLYSKCKCGYTIKKAQQGFWGMSEEKLLFITFDENGIAIECEEGYRPGG